MHAHTRDPSFWRNVAAHPEVAPYVSDGFPAWDIADVISHPRVQPFANQYGGYLFVNIDAIGAVYDLHAMILPDGRGRAALGLATEALETLFGGAARLILVQEVVGHPMSRPPRSFGFEPCGEEFFSHAYGRKFRLWSLSKDRWLNSRAARRYRKCRLS